MPDETKSRPGISTGVLVRDVIMALITALLLWVGNTTQKDSVTLHVLKQKVDQFQDRYYLDQQEIKKKIDDLDDSIQKKR